MDGRVKIKITVIFGAPLMYNGVIKVANILRIILSMCGSAKGGLLARELPVYGLSWSP